VKSQPFIFIGTHRLKEGKLEAFKKSCVELAEFVESNEPRVIAFNVYGSEDGAEVSIVKAHPDAESSAAAPRPHHRSPGYRSCGVAGFRS
jgi:hypothetical protein